VQRETEFPQICDRFNKEQQSTISGNPREILFANIISLPFQSHIPLGTGRGVAIQLDLRHQDIFRGSGR
jgi:hypothetical protein